MARTADLPYFCIKIILLILRIAHIALAFFIFLSSTGLVVNRHYCRSELKSTSLFVKAKGCHSPQRMAGCPMHQASGCEGHEKGEKRGCCDDRTDYYKADNIQEGKYFQLPLLKAPAFMAVLPARHIVALPAVDEHTLHYLTYRPPIVCSDLPVLLQSFLL